MNVEVAHNADARRFEAFVDGQLARADYRLTGDTLMLVHTGVPGPLEGRGIAAALVQAAFDYAREHGLKVVPGCSYVQSWVRRHAEVHDLLAPGWVG